MEFEVELHTNEQGSTVSDQAGIRSKAEEILGSMRDTAFWELDLSTFDFTYVSPNAQNLLGYPLSSWFSEKPNFWVNHEL